MASLRYENDEFWFKFHRRFVTNVQAKTIDPWLSDNTEQVKNYMNPWTPCLDTHIDVTCLDKLMAARVHKTVIERVAFDIISFLCHRQRLKCL